MENLKHDVFVCSSCKEAVVYFPNETWWDYQGTNPVKLVKCPNCGKIQSVKYEKTQNLNFDRRYYDL